VTRDCAAAELGPDGLCPGCGRRSRVEGDRVVHIRGRLPGVSYVTRRRGDPIRAALIRATDFDGDVCECGVPLAVHPPLPRPKPWGVGRPCSREIRFPSGSSAGLGERDQARVEQRRAYARHLGIAQRVAP
jgi:hypothetical protein